MASFSSTYGFSNNLNGFKVKEILEFTKNVVEKNLPENLEGCTVATLKRKIDGLNLKKEFELFKKKNNTLSEEAKYISFIKNHVSELYSHVNQWAEIFETEEEDKTNRRHRKHIQEMIPKVNRILEITTTFHPTLRSYKKLKFKGQRRNEFYGQNNFLLEKVKKN